MVEWKNVLMDKPWVPFQVCKDKVNKQTMKKISDTPIVSASMVYSS